jgi:outer membrane protein assembly factor BamB
LFNNTPQMGVGNDINATWNTPVDDGGSPVLDYEVIVYNTNNAVVAQQTETGSYAYVGGLAGFEQYDVQVRARNIVGYGPFLDMGTVYVTTYSDGGLGP